MSLVNIYIIFPIASIFFMQNTNLSETLKQVDFHRYFKKRIKNFFVERMDTKSIF
jgi:hypothetical protein